MPDLKTTSSLKSLLLNSIIGFTLVILFIAFTPALLSINKKENKALEQNTTLWANFLALKSIPFLDPKLLWKQ